MQSHSPTKRCVGGAKVLSCKIDVLSASQGLVIVPHSYLSISTQHSFIDQVSKLNIITLSATLRGRFRT